MTEFIITQDWLKKYLSYNDETGDFTWIGSYNNRIKVGNVAGFVSGRKNNYYRTIEIKNKGYLAHRLAWFYMTGAWPTQDIDHINGNGLDNRWVNLRDVSPSDNMRNCRKSKLNTSGFCGVYFHKPTGKWQAKIRINGRSKSLGLYFDKNEALGVRKSAEKSHGFHEFHGSERN